MTDDYYAVLNVAEAADAKAIKAAYLQRAKQCHPDRGGSHELMKRLNEAYAILSNPQARRLYDQRRAGQLHGAESRAFQEEVRSAHAKAEAYPSRWEDFVRWQEGLAADFSKADYDAGWQMGESVSGNVFLYFGAFLGFCLAASVGTNWLYGAFLGAALGKAAHYVVGGGIKLSAEAARAATTEPKPNESGKPATRVVPCGRCGRKLRLPLSAQRVTVKCPACKYHFDYAPVD